MLTSFSENIPSFHPSYIFLWSPPHSLSPGQSGTPEEFWPQFSCAVVVDPFITEVERGLADFHVAAGFGSWFCTGRGLWQQECGLLVIVSLAGLLFLS